MSEKAKRCPECDELVAQDEAIDRRNFIRVIGESTASLLAVGGLATAAPAVLADGPTARPVGNRPAEEMIRELYTSLTADQRGQVVRPYDHGSNNGRRTPTRMGMYNAAIGRRIGQVYTPAQRELCQRILRAIASDENGYRQLTRGGTFDGSRSFEACGADLFGDPTNGQYAWVFTGHHLTVRCDGNSEPGAAFGGPMYYGHSPNGWSRNNIFYYQTQAVMSVYEALSEAQRRVGVVTGTPNEGPVSIQFRRRGERHPGISAGELNRGQRQLVEQVMRTILSPYRRADADEVMEIVRRNGGLERLHLAFYRERDADAKTRWHFWRLEGPGFVWNYRVLPHVHTYVNISSQI
jgi:hypothetical protein